MTTTAREYLRVSDDKSGKMRSPQEQHEDNDRVATAEGWRLGEPYTETGAVSASRYSRKTRAGFDELCSDLEAGRFRADVLMLWEPSRGSRRLSEWARFLELLEDRGVLLHVTSHHRTYDLTRPRDRRSLQEDGTDAEYESGKISERVIRSMASNAAEGRPHARPPYGYRRDYAISATGKRIILGQVPDEPQAAVVRRIFEEIGRKKSLRSIAVRLNEERVPPPRAAEWNGRIVRDIALNPAYAGLRAHLPGRHGGSERKKAGSLTKAIWPAIVPAETFHTIQGILTDPDRRTSRPGRGKHLLSMIAVCGACDGPMAVRNRRELPEYACHGSGHVWVPQAELDDLVERLILGRLSQPRTYEKLAGQEVSADLQVARDELAERRAHHRDMIRLLSSRQLSPTAFAGAEPAVLADVEQAEARVRDLESPSALRMLLGEPGDDIAGRWEKSSQWARRDVVRILFARIAVERSPSRGHRQPVHERVTVEWR